MSVDLDATASHARELIAWADGYQHLNQDGARRVRAFCNDTLQLVDELHAERSARIAMQTSYRRALHILGQRADEALTNSSNGEVPW